MAEVLTNKLYREPTHWHASSRLRRWLRAAASIGVLLVAAPGQPAASADLTPEEQELLVALDNETIDAAVEIARQVETWRAEIARLKSAVEQTGPDDLLAALDDAGDADDEFAQISAIVESLQRICDASPKIKEFIGYDEHIGRVLAETEKLSQSVPFDEDEMFDLSEEVYREEMQRLAATAANVQVIEALESQVLDKIDQLRNPAEFAKQFLESEIAAWLQEPREAGGVTFRIQKVDPSRSLFAEDADIALIVEHQEGISVTATGLYFTYRPGQPPEPRFDKVRVDESLLASLANTTLGFLGDAIPTDFGLPIQIKEPRFNGFKPTSGTPPGSVSFDVEIGGLLEFADTLKLAANDVTIDSKGKVTVEDGFTFKDTTTKVPIGTTGLIFDGYEITLRPEKPEEAITLATFIAPSSGKQSVSLDVSATFGFPFRKLTYAGSLVVGRQFKVGRIDGEIGPERINGRLVIPEGSTLPIPLDQILDADLGFELNHTAFTADGDVQLFGAANRNQMDMALRFDGTGHFAGSREFRLAGAEVGANLLVQVFDGFQRLDLEALFTVRVDLKFFTTDASVEVKAVSDGDIDVIARAVGAEASFTVPTLAALRPELIAAELLKQLPNMLDNLAAAAAKWEKEKKELLANWEKHWRETLHNEAKKLGLDSIETGDPNVDRRLGDIAREGKQGGKWVGEVWGKTGSEVSSFVKDPGQKLQDLPSNFGNEVENLGSAVQSGISTALGFGGGGGDDEPSGPSPAEIRAKALHEKVEKKLAPVVLAANRIRVDRATDEQPRRSEDRFSADDAELHLRFENAAAASEGGGNATLGLLISSSSYRSRIRLGIEQSDGQPVERRATSGAQAAWVDFRPLVPKHPLDRKDGEKEPTPTARIFVDPIDDASGMNATDRARTKLQQLIELNLPEVQIEGRRQFVESRFAVHNRSSEPIKVWVQARKRTVENGQYVWYWSPAAPESREALTYTLEPGERRTLEELDGETESSRPLTASRVRVWAESESGEQWTEFLDSDLHLVPMNPSFDDTRSYVDDEIHTHTYVVEPSNQRRIFRERQLALHNGTPEALNVELRYETTSDGVSGWRELASLEIPPGATVEPRGRDGMRVRASRVRFTAESANLQFIRHRNRSLYLVEATDDRRIYHAKEIGKYRYDFVIRENDEADGANR